MTALIDTATEVNEVEHKSRATEANEVVQYLWQERVALNTRQTQVLTAMNLTLQDLRNINIESDFAEFCQELNLSFGPKIKLKSAIKKLLSSSSSIDSKAMTDSSHIQTLIAMGFSKPNAIFALEMNQNDLRKAIEILTNKNVIKPVQFSPSKKLTQSISNTMFSVVLPMGCIIAWYKHFTEEPLTLSSDSWIECNGQTIRDQDSVFDGLQVPNLNVERRFLRGGTISGVMEEDQIRKHSHNGNFQIKNGNEENICWNLGARSTWKTGPVSETGGDETRPKNMSIVWIMRIK